MCDYCKDHEGEMQGVSDTAWHVRIECDLITPIKSNGNRHGYA